VPGPQAKKPRLKRGFGFYFSAAIALAGLGLVFYGLFSGQKIFVAAGLPLVIFGPLAMAGE
jgi:hypothetical protein